MFNFANIDMSKMPELPHRHKWKQGRGWLGIAAEWTVWSVVDPEEAVYRIDEQFECCYWSLDDGGSWAGRVQAASFDEAVNLVHTWCLMGISDYAFRD